MMTAVCDSRRDFTILETCQLTWHARAYRQQPLGQQWTNLVEVTSSMANKNAEVNRMNFAGALGSVSSHHWEFNSMKA